MTFPSWWYLAAFAVLYGGLLLYVLRDAFRSPRLDPEQAEPLRFVAGHWVHQHCVVNLRKGYPPVDDCKPVLWGDGPAWVPSVRERRLLAQALHPGRRAVEEVASTLHPDAAARLLEAHQPGDDSDEVLRRVLDGLRRDDQNRRATQWQCGTCGGPLGACEHV